ncbi:MAG: hypothetical protein NTW87_35660 [Planctomycetota bacterium]|nr:hypothetical protein [Planctomycetota bacterium]
MCEPRELRRTRRGNTPKLFFVFFVVTQFLGAGETQETTMPGNIEVDATKTVVAPFMGFGIQWDPYDYYRPSPADWKLTLERLDYCRPTFFRVMWMAHAYCRGFDEAGNPKYVWSEGEAAANAKLGQLFAILDYAQSRNVDVMLGEWSWPNGMKSADGKPVASPADPRWARIVTDFVTYLTTVKKYTVIKYYNLMNEPNGGWMWPAGKVDYAAWATGIRNLRKEFDGRGLASLPIAGPDNSGDWNWLDRCANELREQIGAWEMHWYVMDKEVLGGQIEKLLTNKREVLFRTDPQADSKRRFLGEAGVFEGRCNGDQQPRVKTFVYGVLMADYMAQVARAGWMGACAWDLDDAMHCVNGNHHPVPPDDKTLKVWGFWNTQGAEMGRPEEENVRPWFYTWTLMSRLFPKGSRIVAVSAPDLPGFRAVAGTQTIAGKEYVTIMLVNNADADRKVTVRLPSAKSTAALTRYHYFDNDRPVDEKGFPKAKDLQAEADLQRGVEVALPSRGVVFLTTAP